MKKILLIALLFVANVAMTSCTADDVETKPSSVTKEIKADDPGDGTTSPIPTKPPKP